MSKNIGLQLYSLREQAAASGYEAIVRQVADMGYHGVETAGFPGTTAQAAAKLFAELGLKVTSAHVPLPLGDKKQEVLETMEALGKPALVCTQIRPDDVKSMDTIKDLCDRLNQGYEVAKTAGLSYGIHNHWWEFGYVDGKLVHHIMLDLLDPGIFLEVDTYWVKVGGSDPVEIVRILGERAPMLHIKDGSGVKEDPMVAVGDGIMDVPAILQVAQPEVWKIVELDRSATDPVEACRKSFQYLSGL